MYIYIYTHIISQFWLLIWYRHYSWYMLIHTLSFWSLFLRRKWCHSSGGLPDAGEGDATEQLDTEALPYELWKLIIVNPSILGKPWDTNWMNVVIWPCFWHCLQGTWDWPCPMCDHLCFRVRFARGIWINGDGYGIWWWWWACCFLFILATSQLERNKIQEVEGSW